MTRATAAAAVRTHAEARRGWLARGSIVRLLRLLVAVPLIAVVAFAGLALEGTVRQVLNAGTVQDVVRLSTQAGALARALQAERVIAAVEVTTQSQAASAAFDDQVARTDAEIVEFQRDRAEVSSGNSALQRIDAGLTALGAVREQVRSSPRATLSAIAFSYRILVADLLTYRASVATDTSTNIADDVRAAVAVSEAGEAIGQLQVIVLRSLAGGELTPAGQQEIVGAQARYAEATNAFLALAEPGWAASWEQIGTDPQVVAAQRLQDQVGRTLPGGRLAVDANAWVEATDGWVSQMFRIQSDLDAAVADRVSTERGQLLRNALLQGVGIFLVLALTAVLTGVVARRITRRLRSLRNTVTTVAYDRLPAVVRELSAAPPGSVQPNEVADRSVSEFRITGSDEIAEVATATRALHREAVRIAGEQAVMRANIAEIFVHLSRREQRLVDAMLAQVDEVERDEADPERLQQLYQLDHLATRMARINQSLLVLGGSGISRVRQEPVPLDHVIQAALSQIEHYTRVRIGSVDKELAIAGTAVDEIVHLVAELLDNATGYSPPDAEVLVTGHALSDRAIVQVVDQGVGLSRQRCEQLNAALANPSSVDVSGVRAMGLTVVARLAARHAVKVELRPGPTGGTVAEIALPAPIVVRRPVQQPLPVESELGRTRPSAAGGRPAMAAVTRADVPVAGSGNRTPNAGRVPVGVATSGTVRASTPVPSSSVAPPPVPAPLFQPAAQPQPAAVGLPAGPTVNGWFKTAFDGDSVAVVWPADAGEKWATTTTTVATQVGLPRRVPQPHLVPEVPQPSADPRRKLDPAAVSAAMSAYAKGVAGRRAPNSF
ncbi:sensor histidine kinase [Micromonospora andamanensis]|uniref:sensor histidine kinase n=1 Tax=Micromonospora andamanensis TaxID=1287068 RepID=UPI00194DFC39|nr:nitrate- and nitrite sensing domain-containing protein [Micromonospora andamanensis]